MSAQSKNNSLSMTVAYKINNSIIKGKYRPGMKLPSESELVKKYQVSRPTIREAMKTLRAQNLIIIRQGDGTYVSDKSVLGEDPLKLCKIEPSVLSESVFEARMLLEPQIALLAAERATKQEIEELEFVTKTMQEIDYLHPQRSTLDIQFHTLLAQCAHNAVFNQLIPVIYETIEKGFIMLQDSEESHLRAQSMHSDIFEAIKNRKPSVAQSVVQAHIYGTINDVKDIRRKG